MKTTACSLTKLALISALGALVAGCVTPLDLDDYQAVFSGLVLDTYQITFEADKISSTISLTYIARPNLSVSVSANGQVVRRVPLASENSVFQLFLKPSDYTKASTVVYQDDSSISWVPITFNLEVKDSEGNWVRLATLDPQTITATGDGRYQTITQKHMVIGFFPSKVPMIEGATLTSGSLCVFSRVVTKSYDSLTGEHLPTVSALAPYRQESVNWLSEDPVVFY